MSDKTNQTKGFGDDVKYGETVNFTNAPERSVDPDNLTPRQRAFVIVVFSRGDNTPRDPDFTPDKLQFASSDGSRSMPGSLYFSSGRRIRLCHPDGPEVSRRKINLRRYCVVRKEGEEIYKNMVRRNCLPKDIEAALGKEDYLTSAGPTTPGRLIEFWDGEEGAPDVPGDHMARGGPIKAPPSNQEQINAIYLVAASWQEELEGLRKRPRSADSNTAIRALADQKNAAMKECYNLALSTLSQS
jgi:hypothetical protein